MKTQHKPSPYAGQEKRAIKALDESDIEGYEQGRGMGLAKAAELNGYPGPMHVLEMSKELGLTGAQAERTMAAKAAMRREAVDLGKRIVAEEAALEKAFASGRADAATVDAATARIAALQGKLRACHLRAHVEMTKILTPQQVRDYNRLRGYTG